MRRPARLDDGREAGEGPGRHQDAQDAMQRAGLYNLREADGTGQDPAAGTEVPADAVITLTAVKYTDR
ncbi:PASTA domain-containing protein [Amycolatopsis sp. SID8362]|uniref:PASTA domain-containing protein n=1 Tax=Amycolatopsis sp. SID8362 TaxID=2690346 RepID=UPI001EF3A26B|nr:PASTA domain-containing protein [Amycolatopsis sp. SID8362]